MNSKKNYGKHKNDSDTDLCPFGSTFKAPYIKGFKTIHPLNLREIKKSTHAWTVRTVCAGHMTDFKEYCKQAFPDWSPSTFRKYLRLEIECRQFNLDQFLLATGGVL